ncbi:MAG: altronate dehydratase family protein, partial [Anaeroplasmataceae bacterium]|nr:altronate dehydratase family protein [Anaeroplasmataceae bacterium]
INPIDNVAVVLRPFSKGEKLENITLLEDIPQAHKVALKPIKKGENVIKYGAPIGHATADIAVGCHVHTHNVATNLDDVISYRYEPKYPEVLGYKSDRTVDVYERSTGEYGIRNELWIIQTVGCVSGMAKDIIEKFKAENDTSAIDGIYTFQHPFGCSQMGADLNLTRTLLQDMVKHPNAGGVLVLGLGCEENLISTFKETLGSYDEKRTRFLVAQEVEDEVLEGAKILKELYNQMKNDKRVSKPLSVLRIGLKCGGSDGMSGITANPLLGRLSDFLSLNGATTVLGEVPEMFGAEQLLMARAKDAATFDKIVDLINEFKVYFKNHNQVIYDNPSPGNKKGGITTLEDKSLGCTQKAGAAVVQDVLKMGERIKTNGLNLLCTPGNDLVATTTLGCAGCQMVLFTTGRGTPFGGFIPTVKIATNTALATHKANWIDYNAGDLVDKKDMNQLLEDFIDLICDIASCKKQAKNEINHFREISIFKDGVVL